MSQIKKMKVLYYIDQEVFSTIEAFFFYLIHFRSLGQRSENNLLLKFTDLYLKFFQVILPVHLVVNVQDLNNANGVVKQSELLLDFLHKLLLGFGTHFYFKMIYVIVVTEKFVVVESNKLELQNSKCNLKIVSGDHINHKGSVQNPVMVESRL